MFGSRTLWSQKKLAGSQPFFNGKSAYKCFNFAGGQHANCGICEVLAGIQTSETPTAEPQKWITDAVADPVEEVDLGRITRTKTRAKTNRFSPKYVM